MSPKILVFGAGSIGISYTYLLSRRIPLSQLVCVCRSNYAAAKSNGFTFNSAHFGKGLTVKPTIVRSVSDAAAISKEPFDYVVISAKALSSTPSIADLISPAVSPGTGIVLIQNGIGIESEYADRYPENPIISTVVYLPVTQTAPGIVDHGITELLHVGTYPSSAPQHHKASAQAFVDLVKSCSATAKLHDDVQLERWSKLLVNASWNSICALTLSQDMEFIRTSPIPESETLEFVRDVMLEVASTAQACGYPEINAAKVNHHIERAVARALPGIQPSMLMDARSGNRLEVNAIVGNVLKLARQKGLHTPLLRSLYVLLSGLDGSFARRSQSSNDPGK